MDDDLKALQELAHQNQRSQADAERERDSDVDASDRVAMGRHRRFMNVVRPAVDRLGSAIRSLPGSTFSSQEDPLMVPSYEVRFEVPGSRRAVMGAIDLQAFEDDILVDWNAHSVVDAGRQRLPLANLQVDDLYQRMLTHVRELMS